MDDQPNPEPAPPDAPPVPDAVAIHPAHPEADFAPPKEAAAHRAAELDLDPDLRDSQLAQEALDRAVAEAAAGDDEDAAVHYLRAEKLAEAAREWYLAAVACHRLGDIFSGVRPPYDLERAFRMYRRAVANYERCGHFSEARKLSYRLMRLRLRKAGELKLRWWTRVELFLYWAVAGFGYRPGRVIGTGVVVVLFYGFLYWALDGVVNPSEKEAVGFWQCVYFSGITFSTVGYGDFVPAPHARLLALTEGALGAFATSFFVIVLANRLRH